jgi:hypothetical protein
MYVNNARVINLVFKYNYKKVTIRPIILNKKQLNNSIIYMEFKNKIEDFPTLTSIISKEMKNLHSLKIKEGCIKEMRDYHRKEIIKNFHIN